MSLKRKALTFGLALAALCATTAGAFAASAYATAPVNVRSGPGVGYRIVDTLRRGEWVDVDYCRGSWCLVRKSGPDGWVSAGYLSRGRDYYDDYYLDDFYIYEPRIIRRYPYYRRYEPGVSICIGPLCVYD